MEADAVIERNSNATSLRAEADFSGYRFEGRAVQSSDFDRTGQGLTQHTTTVNIGSAIAFADGHFGLSRPISDSFALVAPKAGFGQNKVEVNPERGVPEARTDFFGPAMLPELTSYYRYRVLLDAPNLPEGVDLGTNVYLVEPRYRSGTVVPAGSGATVLLRAVLVDFAGQPLDLELGTATSLDAPTLAPVTFFTSKQGRLQIMGLAPGKVEIVLTNYPEVAFSISVPSGTVGSYDAGTITVPIAALPVTRVH